MNRNIHGAAVYDDFISISRCQISNLIVFWDDPNHPNLLRDCDDCRLHSDR